MTARALAVLIVACLYGELLMANHGATVLFQDYCYEMPKAEIAAKSGATPCPDAPDNTLLLCVANPVKFLNSDWQERFSFNNEDKLQEVLLLRQAPELASCESVCDELEKNGWQPVFLETDASVFDRFEQARQSGAKKAKSQLKAFAEKALASDETLTIYFFPAAFTEKAHDNRIGGYLQALDQADDRFILLALMADKNSQRIAFTAPVLSRKNALRYGSYIKR